MGREGTAHLERGVPLRGGSAMGTAAPGGSSARSRRRPPLPRSAREPRRRAAERPRTGRGAPLRGAGGPGPAGAQAPDAGCARAPSLPEARGGQREGGGGGQRTRPSRGAAPPHRPDTRFLLPVALRRPRSKSNSDGPRMRGSKVRGTQPFARLQNKWGLGGTAGTCGPPPGPSREHWAAPEMLGSSRIAFILSTG